MARKPATELTLILVWAAAGWAPACWPFACGAFLRCAFLGGAFLRGGFSPAGWLGVMLAGCGRRPAGAIQLSPAPVRYGKPSTAG